MKAIDRKLSRYENSITRENRKSQAAISFNTDKPGKPDSVHIILEPAKGNSIWEYAQDIETARHKLEAMTRDFVNPVRVLFYEESEAITDEQIKWHNAGGNYRSKESLITYPHGQIWAETLHRGKWVKENERKQEA
jgi:hypothetical protein